MARSKKSAKQQKATHAPDAKPWPFPSEISLEIFQSLDQPKQTDYAAKRAYQTALCDFCLICRSTLPPARALLLRSPLFDAQKKSTLQQKQKVLDAIARMGSVEDGIAYIARSFTYLNYPSAKQSRLSRISVLEQVLDITSLSTLDII